jgi:preprotein translocase subunit YajC
MMAFGLPAALQTPGTAAPAQPAWLFPVMMLTVFAIFYLLIIMPQRKKQKRHQEEVHKLTPGKQVVTVGGIVGTVVGIKKDDRLGDLIELRIGSNTTIAVTQSAVGRIVDPVRPETR